MTDFVTDGHLGGYIRGGDPATFYPDLWGWVVQLQGVKTVLDVGSGEGSALRAFREIGCTAVGIEGMPSDDEMVVQHDFTTGPWHGRNDQDLSPDPISSWRFDLVWSCEFVEHVEEQYVPNFLETFKLAPLVLMTHASPGQQGYHHVNCQDASYWIGAMAAAGFQYDDQLTRVTRALADVNVDPHNHYARSGLAFRKYAET